MNISDVNSNISFCSIKQDKILCEKMMKQFRSQYPINFHSPSKIECAFEKHSNNVRYNGINQKLVRLWHKYTNSLAEVRDSLRTTFWDDYINLIKTAVMSKKTANCSEQAKLLQDIFLKNGKKAHLVSMEILDKEGFIKKINGTHTFVVTGLRNGADYKNPKTWGSKAIVVDPWSNLIMNATEAIDYFKGVLNYNSQNNTIVFRNNDLVNVEKYLGQKH